MIKLPTAMFKKVFMLAIGMAFAIAAYCQTGETKVFKYGNGKTKAEGAMVGEKKVGPWVFYYESGIKMREGTYTNGAPTGKWTEYNESGGKKAEGSFVSVGGEAVRNGSWIFYHPNGALQSEGKFNRGKKVGRWTEYNKLGAVLSVKDY